MPKHVAQILQVHESRSGISIAYIIYSRTLNTVRSRLAEIAHGPGAVATTSLGGAGLDFRFLQRSDLSVDHTLHVGDRLRRKRGRFESPSP